MKATYFQKPLEFNLVVEGETWRQADPIVGALTVKNHGSSELDGSDVRVVLAHGAISKVRKKDPKAFTVLNEATLGAQKIAPGSHGIFQWKFDTDRNCTITDKSASLFLLYGRGSSPQELGSLGQIQLCFQPFAIIEEYLKSLQTLFRFVLKSQKSNKGWVECKLDPPASRNYSSVEQLLLSFKFEDETLLVHYLFDIKKLEASPAATNITRQEREFEQSLSSAQYLRGGRFNYEVIEAGIQEVISQLGLGALW